MQKRILVIEDNHKTCALLVQLLERRKLNGSGIVAESAYSLAEAGATIRSHQAQGKPFHCIVSDLQFPDSSARATIGTLKKMCGDIPVRALTGLTDPTIIHACRENGIRVILKGSIAEDIMEEVLYALSEREPSRAIDQAIVANRAVTREMTPERGAVKRWKWAAGGLAFLIPLVTFCFTSGASLYQHMNAAAEKRATTVLQNSNIAASIATHTAQITDVQVHVRKLEDANIERKVQLDTMEKLMEKVDHKLDLRK